jgi:hypothetical protein
VSLPCSEVSSNEFLLSRFTPVHMRILLQNILRYFALAYVSDLLRDFMSDVFRIKESELAISRETSTPFLAVDRHSPPLSP